LKEIAIPQQAIIKGDTKSASIAAASILAKVSRDALMRTLDTRHPGYGFADHKGYPVRAHYAALARLGACAAHRRSFGPVREVLGLPPLPPWPLPTERVKNRPPSHGAHLPSNRKKSDLAERTIRKKPRVRYWPQVQYPTRGMLR